LNLFWICSIECLLELRLFWTPHLDLDLMTIGWGKLRAAECKLWSHILSAYQQNSRYASRFCSIEFVLDLLDWMFARA
jgi:hypothetical protein